MKFLNSLDILGSGGTLLDVQGSQGQLFSVTDSLSGSIFAVSDISGVPILDVNSSGTSYFSGDVGIGTAAPGAPLQINRSSNGINQYIYNTTSGQAYIAFGNATTGLFSQDFTSANGLLVGIDQDETAIIWNAEATRLRFGTSGTERMSIAAAGNVGIGTTSPSQKLHVVGDVKFDGSRDIDFNTTNGDIKITPNSGGWATGYFFNGSAGTYRGGFGSLGSSDALTYYWIGDAYNDATMVIQPNAGNVGIGTTSPDTLLHIESTISTSSPIFTIQNDNDIKLKLGAVRSGAGTAPDSTFIAYDGDLRFIADADSTTEVVRIDSSGNVGIGTTSPEAKLHIIGGHLLLNNAVELRSKDTSGNIRTITRVNSSNELEYGWSGAGAVKFMGGGSYTERMRIHTNGNVGIGTNSPGYKLSVDDNSVTNIPKTLLQLDAASITDNGGYNIDFRTSSNDAADRYVARIRGIRESTGALSQLSFWTESGSALLQRMTIRASGNVGIGTTSPGNTLHVYKNATIGVISSPTVANAGLRIQDSGANMYVDGNSFVISTAGYLTTTGSNDFDIGTNSTSRIKIKGDGNVGIGTADPASELHLSTTGSSTLTIQNTTNSGNATLNFRDEGNNDQYSIYYALGANRAYNLVNGNGLTIYSSQSSGEIARFGMGTGYTNSYFTGSVGIGMTTTPPRKLSVETNDTATYSASVNASEISIARKNSSNTAGQVAAISLNATGWSGSTTGVVVLNAIARQGNFSNADFAIQNRVGGSFVETFRITTYGNVGIGTDTPDDNVNTGNYFKPDSGGRFLTAKDSSGSFIMLESSTTTDNDQIGGIYFNNTGGQADAHVHVAGIDAILHKHGTNDALSGGDLRFFTKPSGSGSNGPRMVILENGNVGIGITAPSEKLHVSGNLRVTGAFVDSSASVGSAGTVLSSTNTGTAWVGASGLPGGPYLPLAGGTMTGTAGVIFPDAFKLNLGTGSDLEIYHNGLSGNNNIDNINGDLYMSQYANDKDIIFRSDDGSGGVATYFFLDGGSVATQFSQRALFIDNIAAEFGSSRDLKIYHDGSNSYINDTGTGDLIIKGGNDIIFKDAVDNLLVNMNQSNSVELYYGGAKKFETASTGVTVTGKISGLTAGTANTDAVNVQQLNNATTGTLIYKGTWSAAPTTTSVLDGAVSGGTIVIDAVNPGISVGATITGTGISGTVTVSNIAADGITIAISSSQTIADGTTLTFTTVGGTPDLSQASRKVTGHYYICETAGAVTPNGAGTTPNEWAVGDWATFSDLTTDAWQKIDNSSVLSGAGTGGKVPVWSGTGTSVTLADAPITVSGNNATFAGNITFGDSHTIGDDSDDNLVIASSAGENIIIDSADDIILDAAGNDVLFKDAGTHIGTINMSSSNLTIESSVSDKDIIFKGKDGASAITALTLDMSNGGSATFVDDIDLGGKITQTGTGNNTFGGKVSVGGGDTSTAQVALKGQQSLLSFVRGTSGDAQFFMSSDSSRLYFSHTDIQSTNLILTLNQNKTATFAGDVIVDSALLSNQENTDVDTGTETVASVLKATYTAAFFDFVIKNGTNLRAGTVFACHDGTNVVYTETSTNDLGDTSDVTLSVDISGNDMRLRATVTSDDWSVKSLIRAI